MSYNPIPDKFLEVFVKSRFYLWCSLSTRSSSYLVLERAWPGFNTVCVRHYLPTLGPKMSSSMRRPTSRAGITLVSLKRRRSSARNDAGRSATCLSSNRHDRENEQ
jgi:hypothetical protein